MTKKNTPKRTVTRRNVIKRAAAFGLVASVGPFIMPRPAKAAKTLKILQWVNFVPRFDKKKKKKYIKEWGKKN
ncbi:MAG: twin-arginine translocation signal domain-containing protein, partial [Rhodospirillales bacterium]|nr:twin-arginine translocation signal domain-containing protein [Rhodospirillales bacterium]